MGVQSVTTLKTTSDLSLKTNDAKLFGWDTNDLTLQAVPVTDIIQATTTHIFPALELLQNQQVYLSGPLDVTSSSVLTTIQTELKTYSGALYICANANKAVKGGHAVCASALANVLHPEDSRGVAVNLGDLLLALKIGSTYYYKLLPINEAKKPADSSNVGTYGLMVPNDKEKLDQAVDDIDKTCFRCYQGEYNMNYRGWYGYHMYGTLGRPAGSVTGETYVLRVANGGTETDSSGNLWYILEQTAYSCLDASRIFRRIVKTKNRSSMDVSGNTTWGDWVQIPTAAQITALETRLSTLETKVAALSK